MFLIKKHFLSSAVFSLVFILFWYSIQKLVLTKNFGLFPENNRIKNVNNKTDESIISNHQTNQIQILVSNNTKNPILLLNQTKIQQIIQSQILTVSDTNTQNITRKETNLEENDITKNATNHTNTQNITNKELKTNPKKLINVLDFQFWPDTENHRDPRWFKFVSSQQQHKILFHLLNILQTQVIGDTNVLFWTAYGTLLGAMRHENIIPWDNDMDLGLFRDDLMKLPERIDTESYLWEILPSAYTNTFDPLNQIDARLFSKKTGNYIDIMAVHWNKTLNSHIINHEIDERYTNFHQRDKNHYLPLKKRKFGDTILNVPNCWKKELDLLYGKDWYNYSPGGQPIENKAKLPHSNQIEQIVTEEINIII